MINRLIIIAGLLLPVFGHAALSVNPSTAANLVTTLVGPGVAVSNIVFTGVSVQAGTFSGGAGIIGFDDGIVLVTGGADLVIGPNNSSGATNSITGGVSDPDLVALTGGTINDAATLSFDFIPVSSSISFDYVFSSEEYLEYVGAYNDAMALLVNGVNVATVPGSATLVSINNVNTNLNSAYFVDNTGAILDTQMDGLTVVLTALANVTPGVVNTIKIAIGDASDRVLDSALFLRAGSLVAPSPTPTSTPSPTITQTPTISQTFTHSPTYTVTQTATPTPTFTQTVTRTVTQTITATSTPTPPPLFLHLHPPNPNPGDGNGIWIPYWVSTPSTAQIRIYTVAGEIVRTLTPVTHAGLGNHEQFWDAANDSGRKVSTGVYIYRVFTESPVGETESDFGKFAIVN